MLRSRSPLCVVMIASTLAHSAYASGPCETYQQTESGRITSDAIVEASGLAASHQHQGVLWTHNDSGDEARLFALSATGELLATLKLKGVTARDWESIASAPCDLESQRQCLYVADIGNNSEQRQDLIIHQVLEPATLGRAGAPLKLAAEALASAAVVYPFLGEAERPLRPDAEAMMIDRSSLEVWIATKEPSRARLLRAHLFTRPEEPIRYVGELPLALVTGGDLRPDGQVLALRQYFSLYEFALQGPEQNLPESWARTQRVLDEFQGEAIAYSADGTSLWTLAEGRDQPLHRFECAPPPEMPPGEEMGVMSSPDSGPDDAGRGDAGHDTTSLDPDRKMVDKRNESESSCGVILTPKRPGAPWAALLGLSLFGLARGERFQRFKRARGGREQGEAVASR